MNQVASEQSLADKWAYGLMGGFLLVMFILALTAWIDAQNRPNLEKITEPTAVGDPIFVGFDPRDNPGHEVLHWNGQPYFLQTNEPTPLRSVRMTRERSSFTRSKSRMI
jgi:hypothetical protein